MNYCEKQETLWFIRGHADRRKELDKARREGRNDVHTRALETKIAVVTKALEQTGIDIDSPPLRNELRQAILLNIYNRKQFPYGRLYIVGISRDAFYQYRNAFIAAVALHLI